MKVFSIELVSSQEAQFSRTQDSSPRGPQEFLKQMFIKQFLDMINNKFLELHVVIEFLLAIVLLLVNSVIMMLTSESSRRRTKGVQARMHLVLRMVFVPAFSLPPFEDVPRVAREHVRGLVRHPLS